MKLATLEKNLLDINNDVIPKKVMDKFWAIKEEIGSRPLGISKTEGIYYIVCPVCENFILETIHE